ncbi:MAG: winged helix-turn-helix domain-containing protein [Candidatus Sulfotelmatobacter sp.]
MAGDDSSRIFRFGVFEADSATGELRKSGIRLRLRDQPFHVLLMLVRRRGQLVSREELRQELWPADTFVDFDHSLNTIINKLREVLGDSAANPRFIETLAKRGYRFLPPVEPFQNQAAVGDAAAEASTAAKPPVDIRLPAKSSPDTPFLTSAQDLPLVQPAYVRGLFLLIQIMYLSFYIVALGRLASVEDLLDRGFGHSQILTVLLIVSASIGIPVRLYLLSYVSFDVKDLSSKFLRLFAGILVLDELWALAPFLLTRQIGLGLALAITAALIYVPFAQRTLVLMRERSSIVS